MVSAIEATPSYQAGDTLIVVTWDESNELSVKDKGNWGIDCSNPTVYANNKATCQVITILVSARLPAGPYTAFTSHYALTAAIEQTLGLPLLGGARAATPAPIYQPRVDRLDGPDPEARRVRPTPRREDVP